MSYSVTVHSTDVVGAGRSVLKGQNVSGSGCVRGFAIIPLSKVLTQNFLRKDKKLHECMTKQLCEMDLLMDGWTFRD